MAIDVDSPLKKLPSVPYTVDDQELKGGFRCVNSIALRDAIPIAARRPGMIVRVINAEGTVDYTLPHNNLTNNAWFEQKYGPDPEPEPEEPEEPEEPVDLEGVLKTKDGPSVTGELRFEVGASINFADMVRISMKEGRLVFEPIAGEGEDFNPAYAPVIAFENGQETVLEIHMKDGLVLSKSEVALAQIEAAPEIPVEDETTPEAEPVQTMAAPMMMKSVALSVGEIEPTNTDSYTPPMTNEELTLTVRAMQREIVSLRNQVQNLLNNFGK